MGADGHASEAGQAVRKLVAAAIFGEFATGAEVADPELLAAPSKDAATAANPQLRKTLRVLRDHSAVIVGLKTNLSGWPCALLKGARAQQAAQAPRFSRGPSTRSTLGPRRPRVAPALPSRGLGASGAALTPTSPAAAARRKPLLPKRTVGWRWKEAPTPSSWRATRASKSRLRPSTRSRTAPRTSPPREIRWATQQSSGPAATQPGETMPSTVQARQ